MAFNPKLLVTGRGEIDRAYLVAQARERAERDFGAANPPAAWVRPHIQNLETIAYFERHAWRRSRGLPDDTEYVFGFTIPSKARVIHG